MVKKSTQVLEHGTKLVDAVFDQVVAKLATTALP